MITPRFAEYLHVAIMRLWVALLMFVAACRAQDLVLPSLAIGQCPLQFFLHFNPLERHWFDVHARRVSSVTSVNQAVKNFALNRVTYMDRASHLDYCDRFTQFPTTLCLDDLSQGVGDTNSNCSLPEYQFPDIRNLAPFIVWPTKSIADNDTAAAKARGNILRT